MSLPKLHTTSVILPELTKRTKIPVQLEKKDVTLPQLAKKNRTLLKFQKTMVSTGFQENIGNNCGSTGIGKKLM